MEMVATEFKPIVPIGRAEVKKNGLIIEEGLTAQEWLGEVVTPLRELIGTMQTSALWWWGDALAYGERRYGEMYSQALEQSDYNYGTLRNAKFVSERIELSCRRDNLSWSHHAEVAAIEDKADRAKWLKAAEEDGMSKSDLRKAIRMSKVEYNDPANENAGQFEAIAAAKQLAIYFKGEDVSKWNAQRCELWLTDLKPIANAYELMQAKQRAEAVS
jgi:hypothetical protein